MPELKQLIGLFQREINKINQSYSSTPMLDLTKKYIQCNVKYSKFEKVIGAIATSLRLCVVV